MNREEILAKSRAEKMDEGMQQAEKTGGGESESARFAACMFLL